MKTKWFLVSAAIVLAVSIVCNSSTNTPTTPKVTNVRQLKITNTEITGWTMTTDTTLDTFKVYAPDSLNLAIDGAFAVFLENGLVEGAVENMKGPGDEEMGDKIGLLLDFGTAAHATAVYNSKKTDFASTSADVPGFSNTVAFIKTSGLSGVTAYAHFNKFYFEFDFKGFTDPNLAIPVAAKFVTLMKSKIE